jgi:hypothetical protein
MPLVTDDYIHIRQIASGEAPSPLGCFTQSCGGPQFFRPLGFSIYWMEWDLWGRAPAPRHALDLMLHAASSLLFLLLMRRLGVAPPFDLLAALLFAWHGIRHAGSAVFAGRGIGRIAAGPQWAGRFHARHRGRLPEQGICFRAALAARGPTWSRQTCAGSELRRRWRNFFWRWWVLKGIGGYSSLNGEAPSVLEFHGVTLVKTFLARIWGVLWFPVNWSTPFEWWMALGLVAGIAGSLALLKAHPDRGRFALSLACVAIACVPVHHMLLIGPSLERSRYLTYAAAPFIFALALAYSALPVRIGVAAMALLVAFQAAALLHNLKIWRSVASARYEVCRSVAATARNTPGPIAIAGFPLMIDGVYWSNGFEDCLWLEFDIPPGKVLVNSSAPGAAVTLRWDPVERLLRE